VGEFGRGLTGRIRKAGTAALAGLCVALVGLAGSAAQADGGPGSLIAWGDGTSGELGNTPTGSPTGANTPVDVSPGVIPAGTTFTQLAAGDGDSFALSTSGVLYAWGSNNDGVLGDNEAESQANVPVAVSAGAIPPGSTITQVAAGEVSTVALSSLGKAYAWGENGFNGQLGDGENEAEADAPVAVSQGAIPIGTTISQIDAGYVFNLALNSTGQLFAWGDNASDELGNAAAGMQADVPVAVSPGAIPNGTTFTQISAGGFHALALSSTGKVYAWGEDYEGEAGNNTEHTNQPVPVAVTFPAGVTITQISAGYEHDLALSSTGQLYAWGDNSDGELGDNAAESQANAPVAVSAGAIAPGTQIVQIVAGKFFSLALSSTGQAYAWGFNAGGMLGNTPSGPPAQANVPVAVSLPPGTTVTLLAHGSVATHALALARIGNLTVSSAALPAATVGLPYTTTLSATGGLGADSWSASGLPAGLAINAATGVISGTPTAAGTATVSIGLGDTQGFTTSRSLALDVTTLAAPTATVNHKTGAISLVQTLPQPGKLSWTLTFTNGADGVFSAKASKKCKVGQVRLKGKCRPSVVAFGAGSTSVAAAGPAAFTVDPSRSAIAALKYALRHKRGLSVTATVTYESSLGGAPITLSQSVTDKLTKAKPKKHKK
jgi:alpha-tubulin suppressor-like RCC1 family protein